MACLSNICRKNLLRAVLERSGRVYCRTMSSSSPPSACEDKKVATPQPPPVHPIIRDIPDFSKPQDSDNWVSYGYNTKDKYEDIYSANLFGFLVVTLLMGGLIITYMYYPDRTRRDWARREAYILLNEREQKGLDLISKDYIDPSKIVLPNDEDIGKDDIII